MKIWIFAIVVFGLGTIIGSFLNVCIYRIPRGISLFIPHRSFCPTCHRNLTWKELIPILSWLFLGRRCLQCRTVISLQYPLVELLTGILFVSLWFSLGYPAAMGYSLFAAILIIASFIDLENLIIPDILTIGGILTGFTLSIVVPSVLGLESTREGILRTFTGAIVGYVILWGILELGKLSLGKVRLQWDSAQQFRVFWQEKDLQLECGNKVWSGEGMFVRKKDVLIIETDFWKTADGLQGKGKICLTKNEFISSEGRFLLDTIQEISGKAHAVSIPREAMGWGDVKLLAAIGAFIGVSGVLFSLFCASLLGMSVGIGLLFQKHQSSGVLIPFGPFLALGALIWILGGKTLWDIYFVHLGF